MTLCAQGYGALQPAVGLTALSSLLQGACNTSTSPAVVMASPFVWDKFLSGVQTLATVSPSADRS